MLTNDSPYYERFKTLLDQIRDEVHSLKDQVNELEKENDRLKDKIEEMQDGQTDVFSAMSESERLSLRHQVLGLISKIDNHLDEEEEQQ